MAVRSFECQREKLNDYPFRKYDVVKEGHQHNCNRYVAERLKELPKHYAYFKTLPCSCSEEVRVQTFKEKITGITISDGRYWSEWVRYK